MTALSRDEKEFIAGRARTLQERLDSRCEGTDDLDSVEELLDEWRDRVADGDQAVFDDRIGREDVCFDECKDRVGTRCWPHDEPLPEWIHQLDDLVGFARERGAVDILPEAEDDIPFVHVLSPFLEYARRELGDIPASYVSRTAEEQLVRWLAQRLTTLGSHTMFIEFKTYVANYEPDAVFGEDEKLEEGSRDYYDDFVDRMLDDGAKSFFLEYPFLSRLFVAVVHQWISTVEEFLNRLTADWSDLQDAFAEDGATGSVTAISATGDAHHGGRTVLKVAFESGTEAAYKPRKGGVVAGFYDLLEWVNANGNLPELRTIDLLRREEYYWMEWVDPKECSVEEQVSEYYRRAGMLICLFYALDATDIHLENIIAEEGHPVSVDLETLAQPIVKPKWRAFDESASVVKDTVVRTGAVPRQSPDPEIGDLSGFAARRVEYSHEVQEFVNVNRDDMEIRSRHDTSLEASNLPQYRGDVVEPEEMLRHITKGFEEIYLYILENKDDVLAEDGPIERLATDDSEVRALYRDTSIYGSVLRALTSQPYHSHGVKFGVKVEELANAIVSEDLDERIWSVYERERQTLKRFNTPRFTAKLNDTNLYSNGDVVVEDFFVEKPIEHIRERISAFSESDLEEQLEYVKWSYGEYQRTHSGGRKDEVDANRADDATDFVTTFENASRDVFDRIATNALSDREDPTWVLRKIGESGGLDVRSVGDGLYEGRLGIGLFAAALSRTFEEEQYERFAVDVVSPMVEEGYGSGTWTHEPLGIASGVGSIIYGFTKIGELLDDDTYVQVATDVASNVDSSTIGTDSEYSVLQGGAGAILGLLALYDATGNGKVLDKAENVGTMLLENRTRVGGEAIWHPDYTEQPLCGFAHGVGGIAYALFRLGHALDESEFKEGALDGIEFERRKYDENARNWPDLRDATEENWMDGWCHGRSGIGLARLGMYELDSRRDLLQSVERGLEGVEPSTIQSVDHVCCGNFGRVEFLLRAGRSLGQQKYRTQARRLANAVVQRANADGQYRTQWQTRHWYNPSFFSGEAGVGYSLLRFIDDSLPSVLLFE